MTVQPVRVCTHSTRVQHRLETYGYHMERHAVFCTCLLTQNCARLPAFESQPSTVVTRDRFIPLIAQPPPIAFDVVLKRVSSDFDRVVIASGAHFAFRTSIEPALRHIGLEAHLPLDWCPLSEETCLGHGDCPFRCSD